MATQLKDFSLNMHCAMHAKVFVALSSGARTHDQCTATPVSAAYSCSETAIRPMSMQAPYMKNHSNT